MTEINAFLVQNGFNPVGKCACKGKPFRWKRGSMEFKLYNNNTWQLLHGPGIVRYGKTETAIAEVQDYLG